MSEDNGESETGDDDERGQETSEVDWPRVLIRRELVRTAVREDGIRKGCKDKRQR
jgi:hypothetical protein